jgi:hypothetical protein
MSALLLTLALTGAAASAEGVTRIQQSDGTVQMYRNVHMWLVGQTLHIQSHDKHGVLEIISGACSAPNDGLRTCLPFKTSLHQKGTTHDIALEHGTVYYNVGPDAVQLPHSSRHLASHEVLVLLHTMHGTYVSVRGTLDEVK